MARHKKTYDGERFTVSRTLKFTPSQDAELSAGAAARGAGFCEFTRDLLFRRFAEAGRVAGARRDPERAALLRELHAIGHNLNQLIRYGHAMGALDDRRQAELDQTILEIKRATARVYS